MRQISALAAATFLNRLAALVLRADRREGTLDDIGGSQVPPVSFWEVEEGEHSIPVSIKGLDGNNCSNSATDDPVPHLRLALKSNGICDTVRQSLLYAARLRGRD